MKVTLITPSAEPVVLEIRHTGGHSVTLSITKPPRGDEDRADHIPIQMDRSDCEVVSKWIAEEAKGLPR